MAIAYSDYLSIRYFLGRMHWTLYYTSEVNC